jgi:hypothetical protein
MQPGSCLHILSAKLDVALDAEQKQGRERERERGKKPHGRKKKFFTGEKNGEMSK